MTFQLIGEIDKEFPIEGRLIVLSAVTLGFNPHLRSYSLMP